MRLTFLGTAPALASAAQDHIYLLLDGPAGFWLMDCGGSAAHQLLKLGFDPLDLSGLILTHGHADHIYGLPVFIQDLWLRGRAQPLPIYANAPTIERSQQALSLFMRDALFSFVEFHTLPSEPCRAVLETPDFSMSSAPTVHSFPCHALRFDFKSTRRALVYSADTAPCASVVALAREADVLLHEATVLETASREIGHSTMVEAATVANEAGVSELYLVHTNPALFQPGNSYMTEAAGVFKGTLHLPRDGDVVLL